MSTGSISSVSCFNMCILILRLPTTHLYVKILLSDPNLLVISAQKRSKNSYDVIFVHLKNEKKLIFFQPKRLFFQISNGPRKFFSIVFWHLRNILLYYGLIEFVRVRTTCTLDLDHFKINDLTEYKCPLLAQRHIPC